MPTQTETYPLLPQEMTSSPVVTARRSLLPAPSTIEPRKHPRRKGRLSPDTSAGSRACPGPIRYVDHVEEQARKGKWRIGHAGFRRVLILLCAAGIAYFRFHANQPEIAMWIAAAGVPLALFHLAAERGKLRRGR